MNQPVGAAAPREVQEWLETMQARYELVTVGIMYLIYVALAARRGHAEYLQRLRYRSRGSRWGSP